jgi:hypothetical protein
MPTLPFVVVPTPLGTITADAAGVGASNPGSHLGEFDTIGMTWKTVSITGTGADLFGDFGSAQPVNFFAVISANAQAGTRVRLRLSSNAFVSTAYDSGVQTLINPSITRADGLYHSFFELPSTQTFRYWLLSVDGHTGAFEASMLVLGTKITPANWYSPGYQYGVNDLGSIDVGRYGVPDLTPGKIFRTLDFTLGWTSESDFETKFRPLVETLGNRVPALWHFDPTANAYRQSRTYMGWIANRPPVAQHIANTSDGPRFKQDFSILSMI